MSGMTPKFKVGDKVWSNYDNDFALVVEWCEKLRKRVINYNQVAVKFNNNRVSYDEWFPHNWRDEKDLELATKLHEVLS